MTTKKASEGKVTTIADDALVMAIGSNGYQPITFTDLAKAVRGTLQIGGRNLLKVSDTVVTNNFYLMKTYLLADTPKSNEECVVTIWGRVSEGQKFAIYNSGDTVSLGSLKKISDGVYQGVFKWKTVTNESYINIFAMPKLSIDNTITRIKLERGNVATDWTPAPEDLSDSWGGVIGLYPITYDLEEKGGAHDSEKAESVTIDYASESECANPLELRERICSHQPFKVDSDDVYAECESLFSDGLPIHKRAMDRVCTDSTKLGHLNGCAKRGCACMFWLDYGHKSKSDLLLHSRNKTKQFANFYNLDGTLLSDVDGGRASVVGKYLVVVKERKEVVAA